MMKILGTLPLLILFQAGASTQETDIEGSRDSTIFSRMEHFYVSVYKQYGYESHEFYDARQNPRGNWG